MSITTIVTFIKVKNVDENGAIAVEDQYQNAQRELFSPLNKGTDNAPVYDEQLGGGKENYIQWDDGAGDPGDDYKYWYLPFIYQGAAKDRSGDNLIAQLMLANNPLAMNRAQEAVKNKSIIEVAVCIVATDTLVPQRTLTRDIWLASSLSYDAETIEVLLSSSIDAVGSNAPSRVLTTAIVGALPTSGQMQNR